MLNKQGDVFARYQFLNERNTSLSLNFICVLNDIWVVIDHASSYFFLPYFMSSYPAVLFYFLISSFVLLSLLLNAFFTWTFLDSYFHFPYCFCFIPHFFFFLVLHSGLATIFSSSPTPSLPFYRRPFSYILSPPPTSMVPNLTHSKSQCHSGVKGAEVASVGDNLIGSLSSLPLPHTQPSLGRRALDKKGNKIKTGNSTTPDCLDNTGFRICDKIRSTDFPLKKNSNANTLLHLYFWICFLFVF